MAGFIKISGPTSKDKKKRPRKRLAPELLPQIEGDIPHVEIPDDNAIIEGGLAALGNIPVASIEQITMPELAPTREADDHDNLGFGDEGNDAAQLIMALADFRQPDAFEKAITDIEAAIRVPSSLERIAPLSPPEKSPGADDSKKRKRTSDESEMSKRQKVDDGTGVAVNIQEENLQPEVQAEMQPPEVRSKKARRKFPNVDVIQKKVVAKSKQWADESIYGTNIEKEDEFTNVEKIFDNLVGYLDDDTFSGLPEEVREIDSNVASGQQSTQLEPRGRATDSPQLGTASLPYGASTPQESLIQPVALRDSDEAIFQPVHSTPIVPTRSTFTPREEPIIEEEIEISAIQHAPVESSRPSLSTVAEEEQAWSREQSEQNRIVEIVKNWDYEQADLMIENLCPIPINRHNMCVTFTGLLVLYKHRLVDLEHKPDSLELGKILPGVRLLSQNL